MRNKVIKIVLLFVCCLCIVVLSILLYLYYQKNYVYQCDEYLTNAYIVNCNDTQFLFLEFDTSSVEKTFGTSAIFLSSNYVSKDITTSEIHINILGKYAAIKENTKLYSSHYVVLSIDDFLTNRTLIISGYSRKKMLTIYKENNKISILFDSSGIHSGLSGANNHLESK